MEAKGGRAHVWSMVSASSPGGASPLRDHHPPGRLPPLPIPALRSRPPAQASPGERGTPEGVLRLQPLAWEASG
eukprot:3940720-Alexandrium_andersonii.AAC.1